MSYVPGFALTLIVYVFCARFCLMLTRSDLRSWLFAAVNLATFAWLSLLASPKEAIAWPLVLILIYVLLMVVGFFLTRSFAQRERWLPWFAFVYPIGVLIFVRYMPFIWSPLLARLNCPEWVVPLTIIGLSYMAFRLSYLVLEVRNGVTAQPTLGEYLGFAFFLPTLVVGPINPFSRHQSSFNAARSTPQVSQCLLRIIVGATKYLFLGNLANQLAYGGIFLDGKPHGAFDLAVAIVFYYLYLYANFSGFCDIAIGLAGLIGISVKENFDNPFAARNVKEFWNRWHITLSDYANEVVFAPTSKALMKSLGGPYANLSIALSILLVFLVIGVWHGVGWRYAAFGLIHAVGVIANHFYTVWLKRRLGREGYRAYNEHALVNALAMGLTFAYVATSFVVFANDLYMMKVIGHGLRAGFNVR